MSTTRLPFDTSNARRQFARVVARHVATKRRAMWHARGGQPPTKPLDTTLLSATQAMAWLGLSATPFYHWRNRLGIRPVRKGKHLALYLRRDVVRIRIAAMGLAQLPV